MKIDEKRTVSIPLKRLYTPEELSKFDNLMNRVSGNVWEAGITYGAYSKYEYGIGFNYRVLADSEGKSPRANQFWNFFDQWNSWKRSKDARRDSAIRHADESYEQFAGTEGVQDHLL